MCRDEQILILRVYSPCGWNYEEVGLQCIEVKEPPLITSHHLIQIG